MHGHGLKRNRQTRSEYKLGPAKVICKGPETLLKQRLSTAQQLNTATQTQSLFRAPASGSEGAVAVSGPKGHMDSCTASWSALSF